MFSKQTFGAKYGKSRGTRKGPTPDMKTVQRAELKDNMIKYSTEIYFETKELWLHLLAATVGKLFDKVNSNGNDSHNIEMLKILSFCI